MVTEKRLDLSFFPSTAGACEHICRALVDAHTIDSDHAHTSTPHTIDRMIYRTIYFKRLYFYLPFNKSGRQDASLRKLLFMLKLLNVDVWTCDIYPHDVDQTFHLTMGWEEGLKKLEAMYGKKPLGIIANPVCTYLTYAALKNFPKIGNMTPEEVERFHKKEDSAEVCNKIRYMLGVEVIMFENPPGFLNGVMPTYESASPWNFVANFHHPDPEDNHSKVTQIWSGGNAAACRAHPLSAEIKTLIMPKGCVTNFVATKRTSDERSVFSPGFSDALSAMAIKRSKFIFVTTRTGFKLDDKGLPIKKSDVPADRIPFEWFPENLHVDKREKCGTKLGYDAKGNVHYCNLPANHHLSLTEMKRGVGTLHGVFDFRKSEYVKTELDFAVCRPCDSPPTVKRTAKGRRTQHVEYFTPIRKRTVSKKEMHNLCGHVLGYQNGKKVFCNLRPFHCTKDKTFPEHGLVSSSATPYYMSKEIDFSSRRRHV